MPPIGKDREPVYLEYSKASKHDENTPNDLRLYCFRASESVVILFSGDIKTKRFPQDCDNVRSHFKTANLLSKLLDQAIRNKELTWNDDWSDFHIENDFKLEWD